VWGRVVRRNVLGGHGATDLAVRCGGGWFGGIYWEGMVLQILQ
jgi:hypothetical protein